MAGFPTASGHPNYSGTQIPIKFAKMLLAYFYISTCLSQITTTEWEEEIKAFGDTLRIRTLPTIPFHTYYKGMEIATDEPDPGYVDLVIDQGLYANYILDKIDIAQMDYDAMSKWSAHLSRQMKVEMDRVVLSDIYGDVDSHNAGLTAGATSGDISLGVAGSALALSKTDIIDKIVDCGVVLDDQNIPWDDNGRFIVLPTRAAGLIKKSDLKDASLTGDGQSMLRNGRIGMIDRFNVYVSNQLTTSTQVVGGVTKKTYNAIFGHKCATAWATQVVENTQYEPEKRFGKGNKQMTAFGYKVVQPTALGHLYFYTS